MQRNRAFTLWELLAAVAMVALWLLILAGSPSCSRILSGLDRARQKQCMANLNWIGKAMWIYVTGNDDHFPRLANDADPISGTLNGAANTYDHIFPETPGGTDNSAEMAKVAMQNVWLMIKAGHLTEEAFHCPSDGNWKERSENARRYGWEYKSNFSYGMQWPYELTGGEQNPAALNDQLDGGVVVFADQNPATLAGSTRGKAVSSQDPVVAPSNHPYDGEAVLTMNGSTSFYRELDQKEGDKPKDSKAGKRGDEIYEANGDGTMPQDGPDPSIQPGMWDTYIVPTVGEDSPP